jgi:hypothetical protein
MVHWIKDFSISVIFRCDCHPNLDASFEGGAVGERAVCPGDISLKTGE